MSEPTDANAAKGFNKGADRVVEGWRTDWEPFFADVCARTGLSRLEAMAFHLVVSCHVTNQAAQFIASKFDGLTVAPVPKEPWEE